MNGKQGRGRNRGELVDIEENVDVVVMGGGGAGLAAAVSAASQGARTILLEKQSTVGGTTKLAVGSMTAAGTPLQAKAGIVDDDLAAFVDDTRAFAPELMHRDNPDLRWMMARHAAETVKWVEELGVVFAGPFPEPPHRIPRMHNAMPSARSYVDVLSRAARKHGVTVVTNCEVTALDRSAAGRVSGVHARHGGRRRHIVARLGVVVASGDFGGGDPMKRKYLTEAEARARPVNPTNVGDGLRVATEAGAATVNMDVSFAPQFRFWRPEGRDLLSRLPSWRWLMRFGSYALTNLPSVVRPILKGVLASHMSPATELFESGCILVDTEGRQCDPPSPEELARRPDVRGFILAGGDTVRQLEDGSMPISTAPGVAYAKLTDYLRFRPDITRVTADLDELCRHLGLTQSMLADSVDGLRPPFLALGPVHAAMAVTEGGVAIDQWCRVLDSAGAVIPGLVAAGGVGQGGLILKGHGLHLLWALLSGRRAGEVVTWPPEEQAHSALNGSDSADIDRKGNLG